MTEDVVKRVRITEIHPDHLNFFLKINPDVIGSVVTLDINTEEEINGWTSSRDNMYLYSMFKKDISGFPIRAFHYEEVADENLS